MRQRFAFSGKLDITALRSYVGLGLLFSVFVGAVNYSGITSGAFFVGSFAGSALASAASIVLGTVIESKASTTILPGVGALGSALSSVGLIPHLYLPLTDEGAGLFGMMFGAGAILLALAWIDYCSSKSFTDAFRLGYRSLFVGAVTFIVAGLLYDLMNTRTVYIVYLCIAFVALAIHPRVIWTPPVSVEKANEPGATVLKRLASTIATSWAPVCGLAICVFLLGTLWPQPSSVLGDFSTSWQNAFGPLGLILLVALWSRRIKDYEDINRIVWRIVSLAVAIFFISPTFEELSLPHGDIILENLQNAGVVGLLLCALPFLMFSARTNNLPVISVFGIYMFLISLMAPLGMVVNVTLGQMGSIIVAIVFILYICAIIIFLAWAKSDEKQNYTSERHREAETDLFEAYFHPRCLELSRKHELTPRESEMLIHLARGHSYAYIAKTFYLSEATVRTHARNIYHKIKVSSQEALLNLIDRM